jgi:hypothetical protein
VIERAVGGFLVAFFVIGYFWGDFTRDRDLLIVALVALAIGVGVALWLRPGRRGEQGSDPFDPRATRRAVRRGVIRTGLAAVVWVVAVGLLASFASAAWQSRGDRREHFKDVATYGFFAGHPGFRWTGPASCCNTGLRSSELMLTLEPKVASPLAQTSELELRLDLRGRLEDPVFEADVPKTGVEAATAAFSLVPKSRSQRLLAQLPANVVATAVVELRRGVSVGEANALLAGHRTRSAAVYLEPRDYLTRRAYHGGSFATRRVSWPNPAIAGFQAWFKLLRKSDDSVLNGLGLPSVVALRSIAERPRIYGFVLDRATRKQLLSFLGDPRVVSVAVGDVAFKVSP